MDTKHIPDINNALEIDYTAIGQETSIANEPLTVTISGPDQLMEGQIGTWTANVSTGQSPYDYTWYTRRDTQTLWGSPSGTGSSFSDTYFSQTNVSIKVEVEDEYGNTGSGQKYVMVSGLPDLCPPCVQCPCIMTAEAVPDTFVVDNNYPNPFNPTTKIEYGVPEEAEVLLNVYNVLGQKVATLVDETKGPGFYSADFDGSRLASGFYIARLIAKGTSGEPFVRELKMQLIK